MLIHVPSGNSQHPRPAGDSVPGSPDNPRASDLVSGLNEDSWLEYARTKANEGDEAWAEKLWNYYATEASSKTARDWTERREASAYQTMMADLKAAGISPYVLSGASPVISNSQGKSYSGTEVASRANNRDSNSQSEKNAITQSILKLLGVALGAAIYALV